MIRRTRPAIAAASLLTAALCVVPRAPALADNAGGAPATSTLAASDGASIYQHVCQGCHMANGRGASGAGTIPALAGNDKLEASSYPIYVVTHGLGGMPAVGWILDDHQVAAVIGYVRTSWGNHWTDPVAAAEIASARPPAAFKPED